MKTIEITEEEWIDRMAINNVKFAYTEKGESQVGWGEKEELYKMLYDVHYAMYPLHDVLVRTKNIELKAYLGEVILKLNGLRSKLKNESKTYGA